MNGTNDTAVSCLAIVAKGAPRLLAENRGPDPLRLALTKIERAKLLAAKSMGFRPPELLPALVQAGKRGRKFSEARLDGTMDRAVAEYLAIPTPERGDQKAIAKKFGINRRTFALMVYLKRKQITSAAATRDPC